METREAYVGMICDFFDGVDVLRLLTPEFTTYLASKLCLDVPTVPDLEAESWSYIL